MNNNERKSLSEHKEYVEKLTRLALFFARSLQDKAPDNSVGELLRDRTPLLYHALNYHDYSTKWDNPDCRWIIARADELGGLVPTVFEERMYSEIRDLAMSRAVEFYPQSVGVNFPPWGAAAPGSLKMDPPNEKSTRPRNWCNFHIANALAPRSIFDDPRHLPDDFMMMMERAENEYGFDTLCTGTWLNDHPLWLALFPEEWHANLSERKDTTGWSFGNWGQMVTARGTFNDKAGQYAREHVALRYKSRGSHCFFENMRRHLREFLGKL